MWIQTAKVLGHCFLSNKQTQFILSISLAQGGAGHNLSGPLSSVEEAAEFLPEGLNPLQSQLPAQHTKRRTKAFLFCYHAPLMESPPSRFVRSCRLQVYYCSVRQREEAFSAQYWFCCVPSFKPSACLLALVRLVVLRDPFKGNSGSRVSPSFIPSYSSLNKEPVLASSVNTTKQLSGPTVNRLLWHAMYANLMSYDFQEKLCFTSLRCWNIF